MRKTILLIIMAAALARVGHAQTLNWATLKDNRSNLAYASYGYDFGVTAQMGYGRTIQTIRPLLVTLDYSMPMGKQWIDDFKIRLGAHVEFLEKNGFSVSGKAMGNFRRHQMSLVRMVSFGGEFALVAGYFKPHVSRGGGVEFRRCGGDPYEALASHEECLSSDTRRMVSEQRRPLFLWHTGGKDYWRLL